MLSSHKSVKWAVTAIAVLAAMMLASAPQAIGTSLPIRVEAISAYGAVGTLYTRRAIEVLAPSLGREERGELGSGSRSTLRPEFLAGPKMKPGVSAEVPPPSFEGKVVVYEPDGSWRQVPLAGQAASGDGQNIPPSGMPPLPGLDVFLADGAETALAINVGNPDNLVGVFNQGFSNTPSMKTSHNGNVTWITRSFPNGSGTYSGSPFDPWAAKGNTPGHLFSMLIRRDVASSNTHTVIARSTNNGVTWPVFFERTLNVFQDRAMFDIDRTTALGGGSGTLHDGKIYLCYDNWGPNFSGYVGSFLQIVSPGGGPLTELTISTSGNFNGSWIQPVAGVTDGQVYLMSMSTSGAGANRRLSFHEVSGAGTGLVLNKSQMIFPSTGQRLGTSQRFGVNGHRINAQMYMDIDRNFSPRNGTLYVISDRNPHPSNPALDQGDVYLSISTNGASSWTSNLVAGQAAGKTQFFSMMDVDDNGWIHVAYYQNETGSVNGGVLNASTANVYYTISQDGGATWQPHMQVNNPINTLDYFDPPPDLSGQNYYLIGDYCQIKATGTGAATKVYAFWTGYDKDRSDVFINDKRERVICSSITIPLCPADLDGDGTVGILDLLALLAAWGIDPGGPPDFDGDGVVGILDLLTLLANWGPCA